MLTGRVAGSDESAPQLSGGDPIGTWAATNGTAYLPSSAASLVYPESSTVGGSAWFEFDYEGGYRFSVDVTASISTLIGAQEVAFRDSSVGSYEVSGSTITLFPECMETGQLMLGSSPSVEFSVDGSTGQVMLKLPTEYGEVVVVADIEQI